VYEKPFLTLQDLRAFLLEQFPLAFDKLHPLRLEIVTPGCWKSIEGNEEMAINDGEVIDVAARVKALEQLTA
jgi:hypothetical protein